eukprot:TRINITY_DN38263_c0_g2_i1.p1 TRINITY_DN38263_c0_g2~~TRINITY_DN38263_c0_g2_i1.p1  ORF type:complete len:795 (-),score=132.91 TRINITY_DN38263_c0_g2_i1:110-2494(-)
MAWPGFAPSLSATPFVNANTVQELSGVSVLQDSVSCLSDVAEVSPGNLVGSIRDLRTKCDAVRASVLNARNHVVEQGQQLVNLVRRADRDIKNATHGGGGCCGGVAGSGNGAGVKAQSDTDLRATIAVLEQRLIELQLAEAERRRLAELQCVRAEKELQALAAQAAEAERAETDAMLAAETCPPSALRATLAAEEFELDEARRRAAARQFALPPSEPEEQQYFEWCRMLEEDRPEHTSLNVAEAARDAWEEQLRDLISRTAFGASEVGDRGGCSGGCCSGGISGIGASQRRSDGLGRLDAELLAITAPSKRAKRASSRECFRRLSQDGPWRLAFREVREAHCLVERLHERNNALADEIGGLRHYRLGVRHVPSLVTQPPESLPSFSLFDSLPGRNSDPFALAGHSVPGAASSVLPHRPVSAPLSRGPRFRAPPLIAASPQHPHEGVGGSAGNASREGATVGSDQRGLGGSWSGSHGCTATGRDAATGASGMPKAIVADQREWDAGAREAPRKPEENGLAQLLGISGGNRRGDGGSGFGRFSSSDRFRPGNAIPPALGFEESTCWGGDSSVPFSEQALGPKQKRESEASQLANLVAKKFAEPLSLALGRESSGGSCSTGFGIRGAAAPRSASASATTAAGQRPKQRNEWVTFEPSVHGSSQRATSSCGHAFTSSSGVSPGSSRCLTGGGLGCGEGRVSRGGKDIGGGSAVDGGGFLGSGFAPLDSVVDVFDSQPPPIPVATTARGRSCSAISQTTAASCGSNFVGSDPHVGGTSIAGGAWVDDIEFATKATASAW